jgi:hypothetical protein
MSSRTYVGQDLFDVGECVVTGHRYKSDLIAICFKHRLQVEGDDTLVFAY